MNLSLADVTGYVEDCLNRVIPIADAIPFAEERSLGGKKASLNLVPRFETLLPYYGVASWATVLFLDLRGSTQRAVEHGPKNTYLTMHTLLSTMAKVLSECGGKVCNFRGDGLFGVFGIDEKGENPPDLQGRAGEIVQEAAQCGWAILDTMDLAINPALKKRGIAHDLRIGVGIDKGDVVITRIGLESINELTVYGSPVNKAAKLCGSIGNIVLSLGAQEIYPTSDGRVTAL